MLQRLSEQIQACHESAAEARLKADAAADPVLKIAFLDMEKRWLTLASSYAFTESLGHFTAALSDGRRKQAHSERLPLTDWLFWRWKQAPRERLLTDPLFDLLPVAIYVCDPDGLILFYNRRAVELWGRSPKLGDPSDRFCGSYRLYSLEGGPIAHAECPMAQVLRSGVSVNDQEIMIERPDGSRGIVLVNIGVLKDRTGNLIGAVNCFQDITERRRNEETVQWPASIVETSDDAILTKSLDGIITSWNKGAERLFGYTAEEVVDKPVTILIPPDRHHEEPTILERIRNGERIEHYETVRRRKDGGLVEISLRVSPIKSIQGKIVGASDIGRDITERTQSAKQIATLAREVEHRGKNLLTIVQATIHLSRSDTPNGLKAAIEGRVRALANVHSLFGQSLGTGADLYSLVKQELEPYCQGHKARTRIDGPQLILEPNIAQPIAMTLHELATNAAKYGALSIAKGRVEVAWSRSIGGTLALRWAERGGPAVSRPTRQGFGKRVTEQMIKSLNGKIRRYWRAEGLTCKITVPM